MEKVVSHLDVKELTETEIEIVRMLSNGKRPKEMKEIDLSPRTIEAHLDNLRDKFDIKTREQLVATFIRNKIIE